MSERDMREWMQRVDSELTALKRGRIRRPSPAPEFPEPPPPYEPGLDVLWEGATAFTGLLEEDIYVPRGEYTVLHFIWAFLFNEVVGYTASFVTPIPAWDKNFLLDPGPNDLPAHTHQMHFYVDQMYKISETRVTQNYLVLNGVSSNGSSPASSFHLRAVLGVR